MPSESGEGVVLSEAVVFKWGGGPDSRAMASGLSVPGFQSFKCFQLEADFKAFRN